MPESMDTHDNDAETAPSRDDGIPWFGKGSPASPAKVKKEHYLRGKIVLVVILAILIATAFLNPGSNVKKLGPGIFQYPPSFAGIIAGCTGIVTYPPIESKEVGWVALRPRTAVFNWRTLPPLQGNFNANAWKTPGYILSTSKTQPSLSQSVSDLYRGWVYLWYARAPKAHSLDGLAQWIQTSLPGTPVVAAKWPLTGAQYWPAGHTLMLASWGKREYCSSFNGEAVEEFRASTAGPVIPGIGVPLTATGPEALVRTIDLPR